MRAHTELGGGGEWSEAVTIVDKSIRNDGSCSNDPPSTTGEMYITDVTPKEEEDTKRNAAIKTSMILRWHCLLVPYLLRFYI